MRSCGIPLQGQEAQSGVPRELLELAGRWGRRWRPAVLRPRAIVSQSLGHPDTAGSRHRLKGKEQGRESSNWVPQGGKSPCLAQQVTWWRCGWGGGDSLEEHLLHCSSQCMPVRRGWPWF